MTLNSVAQILAITAIPVWKLLISFLLCAHNFRVRDVPETRSSVIRHRVLMLDMVSKVKTAVIRISMSTHAMFAHSRKRTSHRHHFRPRRRKSKRKRRRQQHSRHTHTHTHKYLPSFTLSTFSIAPPRHENPTRFSELFSRCILHSHSAPLNEHNRYIHPAVRGEATDKWMSRWHICAHRCRDTAIHRFTVSPGRKHSVSVAIFRFYDDTIANQPKYVSLGQSRSLFLSGGI